MLYSIIPPIIIILCLTGIIMLLVKKSKQVAAMAPEELAEKEILSEVGLGGKIKERLGRVRWDDAKHSLLGILEKITRKTRMIFLKMESRCGSWSTNIRNKRRIRTEEKIRTLERIEENSIIKKIENYKKEEVPKEKAEAYKFEEKIDDGKKKTSVEKENWTGKIFTRRSIAFSRPLKNPDFKDEERQVKPIISEKIVAPHSKVEMRDRLEELLIERIALNPKDIEAYERLGEYYLEIKSYADSKECFKQVLKLNPQDRNAKYRMKRLENLLAKE